MKNHTLNAMTAAILPLSLQLGAMQTAGAYGYIGHRGKSAADNYVKSYTDKPAENSLTLLAKPLSLMQAATSNDELTLYIQENNEPTLLVTETFITNPDLQLQISKNNPITELVIIDQAVPDKHLFYKDLKPNTAVHEIVSGKDGLIQLNQILSQYQNLDALHLVSHAADGVIYLGNTQVTEQLLKEKVDTFSSLNNALKDDADLLLYGCNLAKTEQGEQLLELIANESHIDVAASNDFTGNIVNGGDWDFEITKGDIETSQAFSDIALKDFSELLAAYVPASFCTQGGGYCATNSSETSSDGYLNMTGDGTTINSYPLQSIIYTYKAAGYTNSLLTITAAGAIATFDLTAMTLKTHSAANCSSIIVTNNTNAVIETVASPSTDGDKIITVGTNTTGISSVKVSISGCTNSNQFGLKSMSITPITNADPTETGTFPTDITVIEDTASNLDLSGLTLADVDSAGDMPLTLTATGGTMAASDAGGVVIGGTSTGTLSLTGTVSEIDTFLNTASNIKYTSILNENGGDAQTVAVKINDQDGSGDVALGTFNVDITADDDIPTVATTPATVTVVEDTESNIDLSTTVFAEIDGETITVTLAIDAGTFSTPVDGSGVGAGVTETLASATSITLAGTAADINTYLDTTSNIKYTGASNVNGNGAATITVSAVDSAASALASNPTVSINITATNDLPTEAGSFPTDIIVIEDTASDLDLSGLTLADGDSAGDMPLTLTATGGTMAASDAGGVVIGGTGTGTLTLTGTVSEIDTYLNTASNIKYTSSLNENGLDVRTVAVKINDQDGSGDVALGTFNVDITAVNDDPTETGSFPSDITVLEDTAGDLDLSGLTLADVDSGANNSVVTLTASAGTMAATTAGSVTVGGSGTGTMTLTGAIADIDTYLNTTTNIKYTGASNVNGNDAATIAVKINDGGNTGTGGGGDIALGTVNMDITAADDAPTGSGAASPASFTEDTQDDLNLSAFTVADADSASVTVTLTANEGALAASTSGGVTVEGTSGALTLTGSPANINTYLDTTTNVAYTGATNDNGTPAATITITGADATTSAVAMGTVNLNITAVDDAPTVSAVPAESVVLSAQQYIDLAASTVVDVDSTSITASISVDSGTLVSDDAGGLHNTTGANIVDNGGVIEVTGTPTQVNAYLDDTAELKFTSAASTANVTLTVSIDDSFNTPVTDTATISVLDVAKPTASNYTDLTNEDTAVTVFSNTELPTTVDTDGGTAHTVEYITIDTSTVTGGVLSLTGTPTGGTSTIGGIPFDTATGALSGTVNLAIGDIGDIVFTPTANLNGAGAGDFNWSVTDSGGDTSPAATYTLDITAVNDNPTGVSEPASIIYVEETADDLDISAIVIDDVDSASLDLVLTVGSGTLAASNGGSVTVANSGSSAITLTGAPANIDTYLNTASNIQYTPVTDDTGTPATTLVITASDGDGASNINLATINMNISNVNDEPTITGTNDTATLLGGAGTAVVFSSNDIAINVTAKDPADLIASVVLTVTNVTDTEFIVIDGGGSLSLTAASGPADIVNIAYTIAYSGTTTTITFTGTGGGTMTQAVINTALNGMTYENTAAAASEADRVFVISQIVDNGSTGGSHDNTWSAANVFSTITVVDASKPTASNYTDSTAEDVAISVFSNTELPTTVDTATSDPIEYITIITGNITGGVLSLTGTPTGGTSTVGAITFDTATGDLTGTVNIAIGDIGDLVFTPTTDLAGTSVASIIWTVTDDAGHTSPTATYTLDITNTSDDPLGADKTIALLTTASHTFAASDFGFSDVDTGDALNRVRIDVQTLTGGTLKLSNVTVNDADWIALANIGNLVYAPTAAGSDTFTFTVEDDSDNSTDATPNTITFTVTPDNTAPVISSGISTSVTMSEDGEPTAFSLTLSASDANADTLSWAINGGASNGIAYTTGTGNSKAITYTPSANFFGNDNFTVQVSDGALSDTILVNVNVTSVNDIPVITGTPATSIAEGATYSFTPSTSDVDSTGFIYSITNKPSWAAFNTTTGALAGTPTNDDVGSNSNIIISVSDGVDSVKLPSFAIAVTSTNTAPIVGALSISLNEDEELKVDLSATDTDADDTLTLSIVSEPTNGTLTASSSHIWTYQPDENFHGTDSFTYKANDTEDDSNIATVSITVTPENDKPVAIDDVITLAYNSEGRYSLGVLDNDTDVDEDDLSIVNASVDLGSVTVDKGQLIYQALASVQSNVSFTYVISDGKETAQAKVALTIEDAPTGDLPVITLPANVTVNSTGLFTKVDLGVATAVDSTGKPVPVSLKDNITFFEPGNNIAYWQAVDENGLTSIAMQKVVVIPLISIRKSELSSEGTSHKVGVYLNGASPTYPVVIAYTVSGNMDASDHDLVSGNVTIEAGESSTINFNVLSDSIAEDLETLTITLDNGASYTLTVSEQNIAPEISYTVTQDDEQRSVIEADAGDVIIQAQVSDGNPEDTHTYAWSNPNGLGNGDNATFTLSTTGLAAGIQEVILTVTDNAEIPASTSANIYLEVRVALPTLTSIDTDGDLIPDDQEGLGDEDSDGIPDYLDVPSACNVMPEQAHETQGFLVEGNPGVCLRKGSTVVDNETGGLELKANEVNPDEQATNVSGLFDFIAYGLPKAGQTYELVLPQRLPIPGNAIYRKYTTEKGWFEFVVDANNNYASSAGDMGFCPPPADSSWTIGLTEGHWCVRLTLEDGGPNDDDGEANGSIADPGGVAVWLSSNTFPQINDDTEQTSLNTEITIDVLANDMDEDGDVLTLQSASVDFGVVEIIKEQLIYTPPTDFFGVATINYGVSDSNGGTGFAQVSVDVIENQAPVATNDQVNANDRSSVTIDVLANDTDEDDDSLTVIVASVDNGSVIINADNTLTYTSESGFNGIATISYTIDDGVGNQATAKVTVTVTAYETITVTNKSSGGGSIGWLLGSLGLGLFARRKKAIKPSPDKGI